MTRRKKILLIIVVTALTLGYFWFYRFFDYDFQNPELATFASPDGTKTAYLLRHGVDRPRILTLLASQTSSLENILWIGNVDDYGSDRFNELLWSSDSSLVAARCYVPYNLPEGTSRFLLTHGYDFDSLSRFALQRDLSDISGEMLINRENKLEQLFTQKGGQQSCVSKDNLHNHMRKLKWGQWRQWRARLTKAREKENNN